MTRKEKSMAKKIVGFVKLQVPAGKANPSPPIGPALGQRGLNIMEFCKAFNAQTQGIEPGTPLPVVITAYADKSFTFIIKTPPAVSMIKKAIKLGNSEFFNKSQCIRQRIQLVAVHFVADGFLTFGQLAHTTPSTVTPMERAEPAIVRTAASRSAAVKSFILALAISSS